MAGQARHDNGMKEEKHYSNEAVNRHSKIRKYYYRSNQKRTTISVSYIVHRTHLHPHTLASSLPAFVTPDLIRGLFL